MCFTDMQLIPTSDRNASLKWECTKQLNKKRHEVDVSIRKNSWFEFSNLSLAESIKFIYWWSVKMTQSQIMEQLFESQHCHKLGYVLQRVL